MNNNEIRDNCYGTAAYVMRHSYSPLQLIPDETFSEATKRRLFEGGKRGALISLAHELDGGNDDSNRYPKARLLLAVWDANGHESFTRANYTNPAPINRVFISR